jgi:hypothetical protein
MTVNCFLAQISKEMAEGEGLEPTRPKPPVFKTGALPIMLTLRRI